jgi:hypothetical protein
MLQTKTVSTELLGLLKALMDIEEFQTLRLVGGTSLALQIGHRNSIDIDLFGRFDTSDEFTLTEILSRFGNTKFLSGSKSIKVYLINGVKVDIVNYPYEWIDEVIIEDNIRLASQKDIAAMKIAAITQRGSRKDFIDLYFLLQKYSLQEIFNFYETKITDCNTWLALRSLSYFEDAEQQPMPKMYIDVSWEDVKNTVKRAIANF